MTKIVNTPDGPRGFPDTMSDAAIKEVLRKKYPSKKGHANVPEFKPVGVKGYDPKTGEVTTGTGTEAFVYGASDLPVVGPVLKSAEAAIGAGIAAPFSDKTAPEIYKEMRGLQEKTMASHPKSTLAGNVAGTALILRKAPGTKAGKVLGLTGSLPARTGYGAISGVGINAADVLARGGSVEDAVKAGAVGGVTGAVLPVVGDALLGAGSYITNKVGGALRSVYAPASEALRRVGKAVGIDAATPGGTLNAADIAAAQRNAQPIINADLGGETTRALTRVVANQSPEARGRIERVVSDRFAAQGDRVARLVNRLTGGKTDDLLMQDALRDLASAANKPAYDKAANSPAAQSMWNGTLQQLMQAPAIQSAVRQAETRGANRAAVGGFQAVKNPFVEVNGQFALRDPNVTPNLRFWDQVKRNLDSDIDVAKRGGDKTLFADLTALKNKLVATLDAAVPDYKAARQGAASFFGAEDALDAGRKFARSTRSLKEFERGILAMKPGEKEAFETGFASELIDAAKSTRDRVNVIQKMFGSPENRQKMVMAFGAQRAREIEAFVRVETSMDALRNALGNSTTARQMIEAGVVGGGWGLWTGDWKQGVMAGMATAGARAAGGHVQKKIQGNVMTKMADLLLSDDPRLIQKAVRMASGSPEYMAAVDALMKMVSGTAKATTLTVPSRGQEQIPAMPKEVTDPLDWYRGGTGQ